MVTLLAILATIYMLRSMQSVVVPLVLAILVYHALAPIVSWMVRWHVPRALAATLVMLGLFAGIGAGGYALRDQVTAAVESLPDAVQQIRTRVQGARRQPNGSLTHVQRAATALEDTAAEAIGDRPRGVTRVRIDQPFVREYLISGSRTIVLGTAGVFTVLFLGFFMLLSADRLKRLVVNAAGPTLTRKKITLQIVDEISLQVQRFLLLQIVTSAIVAVVTALALWALGVNFPVVWGLFAGVLNSIPYFGPVVVSTGLFAVALVQFAAIGQAVVVAVVALAITSVEGLLLTPMLQGRATRMNPVALFTGLLFWSWLWGPIGLLLAVPMTAAVKAVCDRVDGWQSAGRLLGE